MPANEGISIIPPPIPAPYLAAVPQLPAELVRAMRSDRKPMSPAGARRLLQLLRTLTQQIRQARADWEEDAGAQIDPEPPAA